MIAWLKHTNRVQHSTRFEMVVGVDTTIIRGIRLWPTPHPTGQADAWDISAWVKVLTERMDRQWDSNYVAARVSDPRAIPPAMLPPESVVKGDKDYTEFRFPNDWLLAEASIVKDANPNQVDEKLPTHDLATIFTQFNFTDFPNIEGFGKFLGYEPKTLQRRFSDLGTSFSKLVDHARQVQALTLLERGDTQIQEISAALGYQNASAFNRAFFRWQGMSPKEWCIRVKDADQA